MARHLHYYFQSLGVTTESWSRSPSEWCQDTSLSNLKTVLGASKAVWIAVSDKAIESMLDLIGAYEGPVFHLSGTHISKRAYDVHFLGSFSKSLFDLKFYPTLKIVSSTPDLETLIRNLYPKLPNEIYHIPSEKKALYHSACVLGGPGSMTLWWQMSEIFKMLGISDKAIVPYLESLLQNWKQSSENAVTGPWTRLDSHTIEQNIQSLNPLNRSDLYQTLFETYKQLKSENNT